MSTENALRRRVVAVLIAVAIYALAWAAGRVWPLGSMLATDLALVGAGLLSLWFIGRWPARITMRGLVGSALPVFLIGLAWVAAVTLALEAARLVLGASMPIAPRYMGLGAGMLAVALLARSGRKLIAVGLALTLVAGGAAHLISQRGEEGDSVIPHFLVMRGGPGAIDPARALQTLCAGLPLTPTACTVDGRR